MNSTDSYSPNYNRDAVHGDDENVPAAEAIRTTVAAVFADRERAHDAVHRLHDEGFRQTWIGITRADDGVDYSTSAPTADETRVESDNWFMRFFGEGDESLHEALLRHGVSESDARAAGSLPAHSALLTVDGSNHPEFAAQILTQSGGQLITRGFGATGYGTSGAFAPVGDATAAFDARERAWAPGSTEADARNSQAPATRTTSLYDEGVATAATVAGQRDLAGGSAALHAANAPQPDARDPEFATGRSLFTGDTSVRDDRAAEETIAVDAAPATGATPAPSGSAPTSAKRLNATDASARGDAANASMMPPDMTIDNPDGASYDDYGRYRAGTPVDESTRLQLREERLRIDKSRVSRGEATIGTQVTTETQDIDVPLIREELFVSRRPASGGAAGDRTPIGAGEVIRVPLSEEKVTVTKVPVITEEVIVGKRDVENVQHISETTRKETLDVIDAGTDVGAGKTADWQRA